MKKTLTMLVLMLPMMAFAQWRVGINGGGDLNHFIIDKQYQTDYQFKDRWGGTVGIMGQYDIADWAGIRFELDWMQKNYRQTRETLKVYDYKYGLRLQVRQQLSTVARDGLVQLWRPESSRFLQSGYLRRLLAEQQP